MRNTQEIIAVCNRKFLYLFLFFVRTNAINMLLLDFFTYQAEKKRKILQWLPSALNNRFR